MAIGLPNNYYYGVILCVSLHTEQWPDQSKCAFSAPWSELTELATIFYCCSLEKIVTIILDLKNTSRSHVLLFYPNRNMGGG